MELSIFLAKIIGILILVKGIAIIVKRKELEDILEDFFKGRTLLMFAGGMELVLGLILVNIHNVWVNEWPVIITIFGWLMLLEGTYITIAPAKKVVKCMRSFTSKRWMNIFTIVFIVIGVYLTKVGFGL